MDDLANRTLCEVVSSRSTTSAAPILAGLGAMGAGI
jgi:hypothetical protein